jgi:hypothetical protein
VTRLPLEETRNPKRLMVRQALCLLRNVEIGRLLSNAVICSRDGGHTGIDGSRDNPSNARPTLAEAGIGNLSKPDIGACGHSANQDNLDTIKRAWTGSSLFKRLGNGACRKVLAFTTR